MYRTQKFCCTYMCCVSVCACVPHCFTSNDTFTAIYTMTMFFKIIAVIDMDGQETMCVSVRFQFISLSLPLTFFSHLCWDFSFEAMRTFFAPGCNRVMVFIVNSPSQSFVLLELPLDVCTIHIHELDHKDPIVFHRKGDTHLPFNKTINDGFHSNLFHSMCFQNT